MLNNVLDFNYLILSLKFEFDIELELGLLMNQAKSSQVFRLSNELYLKHCL